MLMDSVINSVKRLKLTSAIPALLRFGKPSKVRGTGGDDQFKGVAIPTYPSQKHHVMGITSRDWKKNVRLIVKLSKTGSSMEGQGNWW